MRARRIDAVPVVDADGRPVGLHLLQQFLEPVVRTNWAVIMAGGQGVRLRPLTDDRAQADDRASPAGPIIERLVLHLVGFGLKRIFVAVNYLGDVIEEHFGDGSRLGVRVEYLREDEALGTAGALGLLPEPPTEPILLLNGDLVTSADLGGLLDAHVAGGYRATIGTRRYLHTVPFGCVERDGDRVTRLEEKPTLEREVNSGIYALDPSVVARVGPGRRVDTPGPHRRPARRGRARRRVRDRGRMDRRRPARTAGRGARGRHVTLRGTKVLVTGADGFIGSHLTERLVAEGADVRAFCLYNSRGSAGWLDETDAATRAALDIRLGDIRDARFVAAATEGVEIVFHLAALIAIPYSYAAPQSFIDTNVSRHAARARGGPVGRGPALHPDLHERGLRHARDAADPRDPPLRRAVAVRGVEGRGGPAGPGVRQELRAPRRRAPAVQHLRAAPVGAGGPADDAPPAPRRAGRRSASDAWTRGAT